MLALFIRSGSLLRLIRTRPPQIHLFRQYIMVSKARSRLEDVKMLPRQSVHAEETSSGTALVVSTSVSRPKRKRAAPQATDITTETEDQPVSKPKKAKVVKAKKAIMAVIETDLEVTPTTGETIPVEGETKPLKKSKAARKPRAPKPEPVYVIPDVELKRTTFKGRLGMPLYISCHYIRR